MGKRDLEIPRKLSLIWPRAFVFATLDGIP
jgi:hypothetical protein